MIKGHWKWDWCLVSMKEEGKKLDPQDYLMFNGREPPREFYTDEEYAYLKQRGYEFIETSSNT